MGHTIKTPVASIEAQPRQIPDRETLKRTWGKQLKKPSDVPQNKPEETTTKVEVNNKVEKVVEKTQLLAPAEPKKEDTLDECLNEFENFLSELDEPSKKKMKEESDSKKRSRSRSTSRKKSRSI